MLLLLLFHKVLPQKFTTITDGAEGSVVKKRSAQNKDAPGGTIRKRKIDDDELMGRRRRRRRRRSGKRRSRSRSKRGRRYVLAANNILIL